MNRFRNVALVLAITLVLAACLGPVGASDLQGHDDTYFLVYSVPGFDLAAVTGLEPVEDYDGFWLMRGPADAAAGLASDDVVYQQVDYTISLRTGSIDPDCTTMSVPGGLTAAGDGLHLVQFIGPTRAEWLDRLTELGHVLAYIPNYTFVVDTTIHQLETISGLDFVRWTGRYHPGYRIDSAVLSGEADRVEISLFRPGSLQDFDPALDVTVLHAGSRTILASGDPGALAAVADLPQVAYIAPFIEPELYNAASRNTIRADHVHHRGVLAIGQTGAVTDTGICRYHEVFTARGKIRGFIDIVGDAGVDGFEGGDGHGHGTHVAGSMLGDAPLHDAYNQHDGQALGAYLVAVKVFNNFGGWYGGADFYEFWESAHHLKAMVNNNSWGANTNGQYTASDSEADAVMYDYREYLLVMAAGNAGNWGPTTTGSPANAKNVLTVGSLEAANPENVSWFSSRGPTTDGRIKPDVMAPGESVISADAGTVSGYVQMMGTSMAAPQAAGAALLVRDYFMRGFYPRGAPNPLTARVPSAALVKAVLINGAEEVTGVRSDWNGEGRFPNSAQGWGRINLDRSLKFLGDTRELRVWDNPTALVTGDFWEGTVMVPYTVSDFKVTLTWTDFEAPPGALNTLQNDLHLFVVTPCGVVFLGNHIFGLNPGHSWPGGPVDIVNTVEGVHFVQYLSLGYQVPPGPWTIRVVAGNVVTPQPQDFSLAISWEPEIQVGPNPPNATIAVMGDYNNQIHDFLTDAGYNVWLYGPNDYIAVINDLPNIDAVVINRAANNANFDLLLAAVADEGKGLILTSSFSWRWHGIGVLSDRTGQPGEFTQVWNHGPVRMTVRNTTHPILAGYFNNGEVVLFNGGGNDGQGFYQFTGTTLADWVSWGPLRHAIGVRDANQTGGSRHVLLPSFGVGFWQGTDHWTDHAERIFLRSVEWARGAI